MTQAHVERAHVTAMQHNWQFEISSPFYEKRAITLHAGSKGQMEDWISALQAAIEDANKQVYDKALIQRQKGGVRTNDHQYFWGTDSDEDDDEEGGAEEEEKAERNY